VTLPQTKHLLILALVGVGGYLLFMRRPAAASTAGPQAANARFFVSPADVAGRRQTPAAGNQNLRDVGTGIVNGILGIINQPLIRPAGYTPPYLPDTAGEAAAAEYFVRNTDQFAANVPSDYIQNDGYDPVAAGAAGGGIDTR
jgi:hypothetical protein